MKNGYLYQFDFLGSQSAAKRLRLGATAALGDGGVGTATNGSAETLDSAWSETQRLMERLNREMTEQFLEHQRRTQASMQQWELERQRREEAAVERWRREAREHERSMFGLFSRLVGECSAAIAAVARMGAEQRHLMQQQEQQQRWRRGPRQRRSAEVAPNEEDRGRRSEEEEEQKSPPFRASSAENGLRISPEEEEEEEEGEGEEEEEEEVAP